MKVCSNLPSNSITKYGEYELQYQISCYRALSATDVIFGYSHTSRSSMSLLSDRLVRLPIHLPIHPVDLSVRPSSLSVCLIASISHKITDLVWKLHTNPSLKVGML